MAALPSDKREWLKAPNGKPEHSVWQVFIKRREYVSTQFGLKGKKANDEAYAYAKKVYGQRMSGRTMAEIEAEEKLDDLKRQEAALVAARQEAGLEPPTAAAGAPAAAPETTPDGLLLKPMNSAFMDAADKEIDPRSLRNWVLKHLDDNASELSPGMCPNSSTWGMLLWARRSDDNRLKFYEKVYQGMKPNRAELEESRMTASNDDILALIAELQAAPAPAEGAQ